MIYILRRVKAAKSKVCLWEYRYALELERLATALRKERIKRKISLRSLARDLEISPSYLSDLELGKRASVSVLKRYVQLLTGAEL